MSEIVKIHIYVDHIFKSIETPVVRYFLQASDADDDERKCRGQWMLIRKNGKPAFAWSDVRFGLLVMENDAKSIIRVLEAFIKHKEYQWQITTKTPPEETTDGIYYITELDQRGILKLDDNSLRAFREMRDLLVAEGFSEKPAGKIFPEAAKNIRMGKCATCGKDVNHDDFKDGLSRKEFKISGMCQKCQDGVFGGGEEEENYDDDYEAMLRERD